MGRFITAGGGTGGGTPAPPLSFGIGLTQTGLIVDLDPASVLPGEIGGFNEAPLDGVMYARQAVGGVSQWSPVVSGGAINVGAVPPIPVPPALVVPPGTMWWRTTDGSLYVYYFDGVTSQWVTASPTGEIVGTALVFPPAVLNAVYVAPNGITYTYDGQCWVAEDEVSGPVHIGPAPPLLIPPATTYVPGTLWWRNDPDGVMYISYDDGTSQQWVPVVPVPAAGIQDAPQDGTTYGRWDQQWVNVTEEAPRSNVIYGRQDGVWVEVTATVNPAGNDPSLIGIVWVPPRSATQGLELLDGYLTAPLATEQMPGVITEPTVGDVEHVRVRDIATGQGKWVTATTGGGIGDVPADPVAVWGRTIGRWVQIPTFEHVDMKVDKFGDTMTGFLTLHDHPVYPMHAATRSWVETEIQLFVKEPPNDDIAYARKWHEWVPAAGSEAGRGLTLDGNTMHLDVATTIDLGGVFVPGQQGLELTQVGGLTLAPATPEIIGGLLDAPRDDTGLKAFARKWGQWVETSFVDAPDDGKLYGRQWEGLGTPGDPFSMRWMEAVAPIDLELVANNKVDKSGDVMSGALFLPRSVFEPSTDQFETYPIDPYHATPKWYVDSLAGGLVITDPVAPSNPVDGQLWWKSDNAGFYVFYDDGNSKQWVQVNGMAGLSDADVISDAPVDDTLYGRLNKDWHQVNVNGDFKWGFQAADHDGWIKLDGRPLAQLNARQSANASALGFATNIPDATGKVPMQNGLPLGDVSGTMSRTLSQANLPNISLTAGSTGAHTHTAASAGAHQHRSRGGVAGASLQFEDMGGTGAWENWGGYAVIGDTGDLYKTDQYLSETGGAHTHATDSQGAHTHVVPLGGTALPLDITPASLAVTAFIFLGR